MSEWQNIVLETDEPPGEALLQTYGDQGYELVTVVYAPTTKTARALPIRQRPLLP